MRRFVFVCLILFGISGVSQAAVWHLDKSQDIFTETENVAARATGDHGGELLVRCYESKLGLFLRVPPKEVAKEKARNEAMQKQLEEQAPALAAELAGQPSGATENYRFRIDHSETYKTPLLFGPAQVIRYKGQSYVDASGILRTYLENIIRKIRSGKWFVYQIPPDIGPVYKISLAGASEHLSPVVQECERQQRRKAASEKKSEEEAKRKAEKAERKAEEEARKKAAVAAEKKAEEEARKNSAAEAVKKMTEEETKKKSAAEAAKEKADQALEKQRTAAKAKRQALRDQQTVSREINAAALKVQQNFSYPPGLPRGLYCTIDVRMIAGGDVSDVNIVKSSGNAAFDRQAELAVRKASPLPVPADPRLFNKMREIQFNFAPKQ